MLGEAWEGGLRGSVCIGDYCSGPSLPWDLFNRVGNGDRGVHDTDVHVESLFVRL